MQCCDGHLGKTLTSGYPYVDGSVVARRVLGVHRTLERTHLALRKEPFVLIALVRIQAHLLNSHQKHSLSCVTMRRRA